MTYVSRRGKIQLNLCSNIFCSLETTAVEKLFVCVYMCLRRNFIDLSFEFLAAGLSLGYLHSTHSSVKRDLSDTRLLGKSDGISLMSQKDSF